jgi:hypothetical protein
MTTVWVGDVDHLRPSCFYFYFQNASTFASLHVMGGISRRWHGGGVARNPLPCGPSSEVWRSMQNLPSEIATRDNSSYQMWRFLCRGGKARFFLRRRDTQTLKSSRGGFTSPFAREKSHASVSAGENYHATGIKIWMR